MNVFEIQLGNWRIDSSVLSLDLDLNGRIITKAPQTITIERARTTIFGGWEVDPLIYPQRVLTSHENASLTFDSVDLSRMCIELEPTIGSTPSSFEIRNSNITGVCRVAIPTALCHAKARYSVAIRDSSVTSSILMLALVRIADNIEGAQISLKNLTFDLSTPSVALVLAANSYLSIVDLKGNISITSIASLFRYLEMRDISAKISGPGPFFTLIPGSTTKISDFSGSIESTDAFLDFFAIPFDNRTSIELRNISGTFSSTSPAHPLFELPGRMFNLSLSLKEISGTYILCK